MRWYDTCQITHNSQVPQFDNLFICKSKTSTSSTWTSIGSSSVLWALSLLSLSIWGQCQDTVFNGKMVYSRLSCQTMHDYMIITVTWPDLYWTSRWTVHHYIPASAISADFIWLHLISSYMILFVAAVSFKLIYDTIPTWSEEIISMFPQWSPALCGEDGV